jgi:hypothetical protein
VRAVGAAEHTHSYASGSFGPTTAGRMDAYVDRFMAAGGSFVTLAKGNRSKEVTKACKKHGGFYLGSIGGPGTFVASELRIISFTTRPRTSISLPPPALFCIYTVRFTSNAIPYSRPTIVVCV